MMANWLLNTAVVFGVPPLLETDKGGVFFVFSGVSVVSIVLVDLFLPETSGRSLEQVANASEPDSMIRKTFRQCCKSSGARPVSRDAARGMLAAAPVVLPKPSLGKHLPTSSDKSTVAASES